MRSARNTNCDRLFPYSNFLTPQQVSSFFSARLAFKKQLDVAEKQSEDKGLEAVAVEELLPKIQRQVEDGIRFQHPIMYDVHNI